MAANARDRIRHFDSGFAFASRRTLELADLPHPGPIEVRIQDRRTREITTFQTAMPFIECGGNADSQ